MDRRSTNLLGAWRLVATISTAIGAGALAFAAIGHFGPDGLRMAIRFTARTSLILFLLAFSASSLRRLWPSNWTQFLLRNRRYLGLSFAASHAIHATAIIALASSAPAVFRGATSLGTFIFGGIGYVFIAALTATSFDRTAAAIGPRAWKALHTTGVYYLWAQFAVSFAMHANGALVYWVLLGLIAAAMALRLAARLRPRGELARAH